MFTKLDLLGEQWTPEISAPGAFGMFSISAAGRTGLEQLLSAWWTELLAMKKSYARSEANAALP